jgi:hypothetical protein
MLLLVGKDGLVKRRAALGTDLQEIFSQIDTMPMRRMEMRQRAENVMQPPPALQRWTPTTHAGNIRRALTPDCVM